MSVYTHHSNVTCDDCGERHHVGNREDCIAVLKEQRDFAEARVKKLEEALNGYGVHGSACQRRLHWAGDPAYCPCTCGLERVLLGEE